MSATRSELLDQIASTIADYREGEIPSIRPEHVDRWISQFDKGVQLPLLSELGHVLTKLYLSKTAFQAVVDDMVLNSPVDGLTPVELWSSANFLWIQSKGESQQHMRQLFGTALELHTGLSLDECGKPGGPFVYLDDCAFTATHVRWDLVNWIQSPSAPTNGRIIVMAAVAHEGRWPYVCQMIEQASKSVGKSYRMDTLTYKVFQDSEAGGLQTEVLRPRELPSGDRYVDRLIAELANAGQPYRPRRWSTSTDNRVFSSEAGRSLLEQEFLRAGARIKYELCRRLPSNAWPLGYDVFKGAGFGSLQVTYRNCPNNCPLALWAGEPWIPLFPRRNNPAYQNTQPFQTYDGAP